MLGLLVCNRVAVRILAKTPGLSARAHEVQRWDSQVQSLLICCEVHLWTGTGRSQVAQCRAIIIPFEVSAGCATLHSRFTLDQSWEVFSNPWYSASCLNSKTTFVRTIRN